MGAGLLLFEGEKMEPLLIDLEQASQLLNLRPSQLYELLRTRSRARQRVPVPFVKIGKRCMFRKEALQQWIAALEQGGAR
jgi:predicted DNA-binding transcriptional regulator AlpA